jgi:hypothetical protein
LALRISCDVRLFRPAEGGRTTALRSGWRGLASFGEVWTEEDASLWQSGSGPLPIAKPLVYGCQLTLTRVEALDPGANAEAELLFWFLDRARPVMARGTDFELQEGARAIATARVTDIVSETP